MKAEWTLLLGLALGAGGTLAVVGSGKAPAAPPDVGAETLSPARAAPAEVVATLLPAPAPSEPAPPTRGSPESASVVEVDLKDCLELAKTAPGKNATWQVHVTLADLYGHAGREGALRRVLDAALAAGESPSALVGYFSLLPVERRARALASFLESHPEPRPAPGALAWAWLAAGDPARALPAAVEHLTALKGNDPALLCSLYAADADKADFEVWKLATAEEWPFPQLSFVIAAACTAQRQDLVPRWQARMQSLEGRAGPAREPTEADRLQAVAAAEQQAREDPEDADRWVEVARMRAEAGDRRGAIAAWRTAIEKAGPDGELMKEFAAFDAAAAFSTIEAAARESQEDEVLLAYVDVCLRTGRPEEAGAAFFRMHGFDSADWLSAGIATLAPSQALARTERVLAHRGHRDQIEFRIAHADALAELGRGSAAWDEYLRVEEAGQKERAWDGLVRVDPARAAARFEALRGGDDPETGDRITSLQALALFRAGRADAAKALAEPMLVHWEATGDIDDEAVVRAAPIFPERVATLVERLVKQGYDRRMLAETQAALGHVAAARAAYDACIQEGNADPRVLIGRARCR